AGLDLIGVVEAVVRGRGAVPPRDDHARAGEPQRPRPPRIVRAHADAYLVQQEGGTRAVGDADDLRAEIRAHHRPFGHALIRRVVDRIVPSDVVIDVRGAAVAGVVPACPALLLQAAVWVGERRGARSLIRRAEHGRQGLTADGAPRQVVAR